jgi:hypothetical protein
MRISETAILQDREKPETAAHVHNGCTLPGAASTGDATASPTPYKTKRGEGAANATAGNGRLDALKKREADIRARIAQEKVREQKREDKEQERAERIVGRAAVAYAASDPKFAEQLKPALQSITADGEKNLLRARGLL